MSQDEYQLDHDGFLYFMNILHSIHKPLLLWGFLALVSAQGAENLPKGDGNGAYATGNYRNLFAEAGHSQAKSGRKIDSAFQQLFHGDPGNAGGLLRRRNQCQRPLAYITDIKHHDVRTEGLSYGMMIAVQLNKKAEFDALWNWSKTYLYVSRNESSVLWILCVAGADQWRAHERIRRAGRRGILRHGAVFRRASLGQRPGHLQLQGTGG